MLPEIGHERVYSKENSDIRSILSLLKLLRLVVLDFVAFRGVSYFIADRHTREMGVLLGDVCNVED